MNCRWVVFGFSLLAYIVAMMHRSSLGVAGLEAAQHFHATPSVVSTFVVLQLSIYALAQIPVGSLLDRFGPRALLTWGSALMAGGQYLLASVEALPLAYVARALVGLGDACIYTSILTLIPHWFAPRMVPLMAQLAGFLSVFGQLAAIYGLLPMVQGHGWYWGMAVSAIVGAATTALTFAFVRDSPEPLNRTPVSLRETRSNIWETVRHPGTQLGFFIHYTSGFSITAFVFMWGLPYLQQAQGLSQTAAATMFTIITVSGVFFGPLLGILTARHPLRRSNLALGVIWASLLGWAAVLLWPGQAPTWLIVALVLALAASGPGTAIGFDFPRTSLPPSRFGVANGVVISGAFFGGTLTILLIGLVLDQLSGHANEYTFEQWQWAMSVQIPLFLVGIVGIYWTRTRLRQRMREAGVIVPPWRSAIARRWHGRRRRSRR